MALISTRTHGAADYAGGVLMLAATRLPFVRDRRAATLLGVTGAVGLAASAATDYELGLWRRIPMPVHLQLDAAGGALLAGAALLLRRSGAGAGSWLPHAVIGVSQIAGAVVTERAPADGGSAATDAASADGASAFPPAATGVTGEGVAARETGAGAPVAPAPLETPGPSVTPPAQPESDVERAERIDAALPDGGEAATGDELVAQQEAAAAAEAASIGGVGISETGDPAMDPVYEAGGGEQEGWEAAEADLVENATHGDGHGDPIRDAIAPEVEADRSTAVYGEADDVPTTEVVSDPGAERDDPGAGPGLAADRGPTRPPRQE